MTLKWQRQPRRTKCGAQLFRGFVYVVVLTIAVAEGKKEPVSTIALFVYSALTIFCEFAI